VLEVAPAPAESMPRAAPAAAGAGPRYTYQYLSIATKNFGERPGGGGCGSVFQGVMASGTRVAVKRLELGVAAGGGAAAGLSMTDRCCRKCSTSTSCHCWERARTAWRPA
jgi:hypothetical protein